MREKEAIKFQKILSYFLHMNCFTFVLDEIKHSSLYKYKFKRELNSITDQVEKFLNTEFKDFHDIADANLIQAYYNEANDLFENLAKLPVDEKLLIMKEINIRLKNPNEQNRNPTKEKSIQ